MDPTQYSAEIEELARADAEYRAGAPVMSDEEYDSRYDRVLDYEATNPEGASSESPTRVVEAAQHQNTTRHSVPMLSLRKVSEKEAVLLWAKTVGAASLYVQSKIDGVSGSLHYGPDGRLERALTRGDGSYGEDVTDKARRVPSIPQQLPEGPAREIRGEFVGHESDLGGDMKNSRNAVAGAINAKDPEVVVQRKVRFYAFDLLGVDDCIPGLRDLGFSPAPTVSVRPADVWDAVQKIRLLDLPYKCDGVVVKVTHSATRERVGNDSKSPRWAIAVKQDGETAQARITGLKHQVGKTGTIGLVYTIEPTDLAGTTISNLTAHNFSEIRRKDVRRGDVVTIRRMGDTIPGVECVTDPAQRDGSEQEFIPPTHCPGCDGPLEEFGTSQQLRCVSDECGPQLVRRLVHWAGRKAADIDGLSTKMIEQLVDRGSLGDVADFYRLTREDFIQIGRTPAFANKMMAAIETSKGVGMRRALIGLSVPACGEGTSARLAKEFTSVEDVMGARFDRLAAVPDVGLVVATSLHDFFARDVTRDVVGALWARGVDLDRLPEDAPLKLSGAAGDFTGKVCVITGRLTVERDAFKSLLQQAGATVTGSVSKNSDFLVVGEGVGAAKTSKAKALGTTVITEQVARAMMGL